MSDTAKAVAGFLGHKMGYNNIENVPDADLLCALLDRAAAVCSLVTLEKVNNWSAVLTPRGSDGYDAKYGHAITPLAALTAAVVAYQGSKP